MQAVAYTTRVRSTRGEREARRLTAVGEALEAVRRRCDVPTRLAADPVGIVRRFETPEDREIVGLLAACIAFGKVASIRHKLEDALARLGPSPARAADDAAGTARRLRGWVHRVFRGEDIARLLVGARRVQRAEGSLGRAFASALRARGELRPALAHFCEAIREAGGLRPLPGRRGPSHLLPDPMGGGGSKRLLLYLRWMVRPADGVDLGLWDVPAGVLICPVDTHIHKLGRNLGFTRRRAVTWQTAEEITAGLARYDAADPVKYDFALCHMGMLQRCPSRREAARCEGCGVKSVCRHWAR